MPESTVDRYGVEKHERWREIIGQIPYIPFPKGWRVAIIPPFAGAVARFLVKPDRSRRVKSVYLDWYDNLGHYGEPYWEVHPYRGDIGRCPVADTRKLLQMIADKKGE